MVGIPWLKVGAAAVLVGIGFAAFAPRGMTYHSQTARSQVAARREADLSAVKSPRMAASTNTRTVTRIALPTAAVTTRGAAIFVAPRQKQALPKTLAAAKPAKRQLSAKERNRERRRQAYYKHAEKWHKKHSKRHKDGEDD